MINMAHLKQMELAKWRRRMVQIMSWPPKLVSNLNIKFTKEIIDQDRRDFDMALNMAQKSVKNIPPEPPEAFKQDGFIIDEVMASKIYHPPEILPGCLPGSSGPDRVCSTRIGNENWLIGISHCMILGIRVEEIPDKWLNTCSTRKEEIQKFWNRDNWTLKIKVKSTELMSFLSNREKKEPVYIGHTVVDASYLERSLINLVPWKFESVLHVKSHPDLIEVSGPGYRVMLCGIVKEACSWSFGPSRMISYEPTETDIKVPGTKKKESPPIEVGPCT